LLKAHTNVQSVVLLTAYYVPPVGSLTCIRVRGYVYSRSPHCLVAYVRNFVTPCLLLSLHMYNMECGRKIVNAERISVCTEVATVPIFSWKDWTPIKSQ